MTRLKLTLPYPPYVNGMYTHTRYSTRLTEEAKAFRGEAGHRAKEQMNLRGWERFEDYVRVTVTLHRPNPKGDIDGPVKALLDALNKIVWRDDSQIVELHVYRLDDSRSPRVEIEVENAGVWE